MDIIASCKQTRFHLLDNNPSSEVYLCTTTPTRPLIPPALQIDVDGLNILVRATPETDQSLKAKAKGKSKAKPEGNELITDAHLRLKGGIHYGLIGRNGTGKSSTNSTP
jgi:hypothetical protein